MVSREDFYQLVFAQQACRCLRASNVAAECIEVLQGIHSQKYGSNFQT